MPANETTQYNVSINYAQDMCNHMLSLSHVNTLNGKFEIVIFVVLFILIMTSNGLLIYGMLRTKEIKTNTARYFLGFLLFIYILLFGFLLIF